MVTTTDTDNAELTKECDDCKRETLHIISVKILTESPKHENAQYSREPYRICECQVCEASERMRMNNA
jgi:hypothetical protein